MTLKALKQKKVIKVELKFWWRESFALRIGESATLLGKSESACCFIKFPECLSIVIRVRV